MNEKKIDQEKILETILNFADAMEAAAIDMKHRITELVGVKEAQAPAVKEETFSCNKFEDQHSDKFGEYGVAHKAQNLPEHWNSAYHVLKQNNATIQNRYHGPDYVYSYWLYTAERIYRQKLKPKT